MNGRTTAAPETAPAPAEIWYSMSPADQWQEILSAARAACVMRQGLARLAGYPAPEEIAGGAWIRLTELLTHPDGRRLDQLELYAAFAELKAAARVNAHSVGGSRSDDDSESAPIETAAPGADRRPVENARGDFDLIDEVFPDGGPLADICRLLYAGYSPEEIADFTGDSRRHVYNMRDAIRRRLTAAAAR